MRAWVICEVGDEGEIYPIAVTMNEAKANDAFHSIEVDVWE